MAALGLGSRTTEKLQEILATGYLRRNLEVEASDRHRVMEEFMRCGA